MQNPWTFLPDSRPFVLPDDREKIKDFNELANDDTRIHDELLPEPFVGDPDAPVVLLNLNPGFSIDDEAAHRRTEFASACKLNLQRKSNTYRFYYLAPDIDSPGRKWWEERLSIPLKTIGRDLVSKHLCCIEYFPYHSRRYAHDRLRVPSQAYNFELVRHAVGRNAVVVVMRSRKRWHAAVPELIDYRNQFFLNSVQNPSITPRNCPTGFEVICQKLRHG